jgi:hypothetical protein
MMPSEPDLSPFIDAATHGESASAFERLRDSWFPQPDLAPRLTDADGMFRLTGVGRERAAHLVFEGPSIAPASVTAVTRHLAPLAQTRTAPSASKESIPLVGADFEITLPPARAIEGVVRDAQTREVLPNVGIQSWRFAGTYGSGVQQIHVVSDKRGHFRLDGMPKGPGNKILAISSDAQPYLMRVVEVPDESGFEPVQVEVAMHRGIWITGRVTDRATRRPVPTAELFYLPFRANEHVLGLPEFSRQDAGQVDSYPSHYRTATDGSYRLVGLRGPAVVGLLDVNESYCRGQGASEIRGEKNERGDFLTVGNPRRPGKNWPTAMKEIDPARGTNALEINFALDRGTQIEITSVDSGRQPLSRVSVIGATPDGSPLLGGPPTFTVKSLGRNEERTILLHHPQRGLGRVIRAPG